MMNLLSKMILNLLQVEQRLVPPRLSLQSRMLPAVQPEHTVTTTTDAYQQVISSYVMEEAGEKAVPSSQPSGMLARLARRFTSSFAAVKPEMPQQQATLPSSEQSFNQDSGSVSSASPHQESTFRVHYPAQYRTASTRD